MIWKRIKKSTPEQEADFQKRMTEEPVPLSDKLMMILTAFGVIILPCILVLGGMCLLMMWAFGLL